MFQSMICVIMGQFLKQHIVPNLILIDIFSLIALSIFGISYVRSQDIVNSSRPTLSSSSFKLWLKNYDLHLLCFECTVILL